MVILHPDYIMKNAILPDPAFFDERQFPSYKQLKHWFNSCPELVCTINYENRFETISASAGAILGYHPQELIGKNILDLVDPVYHSSTLNSIGSVIRGHAASFENNLIRKDKTGVIISWSCHWDYSERILFCIGRDITQEKNIEILRAAFERKVKNQNRDMLEMMERITDGFYALDNDWRIIYANTSCEQILQIKKEDYLSRVLWDCFPDLVDTTLYDHYQTAQKEKKSIAFETFVPAFNGWFEVRLFPSNTGLSVFFRNINERVQMDVERKSYEERITNQNLWFTSVLEGMDQGFIAIDKNYRVIYWNETATGFNGVSPEAAIGQPLSSLYNEEAVKVYGPLLRKATLSQQPVHDELICPCTGKWVEIAIFPLESGLSLFFKDTDDRKKTELELAKLSLVAQETSDAVTFIEMDGTISWINHAFTKLTGYLPEEAIGKRNSDLIRGDESSIAVEQNMREKFHDGQCFEGETIGYTRDGQKRWFCVKGQPVYDIDGNLKRYFIVQSDITDRKNSEEQIRKLSTYVENTKDLIVITNSTGGINWVNHSFEKTTGYSKEEVLGKSCGDFLHGEKTDPKTLQRVWEKMEKGQPFHAEIVNYSRTGEPYWIEIYGQPFFDAQGKVDEYFTIQRNITVRKQLQKKLEDQNRTRQKLITAAVIKAQEHERSLVGRELHDGVNQVLTTVKLYQELIASGTDLQKDLAVRSSRLLQDSIGAIRSLSKQLSAPTLGNTKLSDTVSELVEGIRVTEKFESVTADITAIENIDVLEDLHLGIYRILQEQFTNILKHSEASKVKLECSFDEGNLTLKISDNGCGFDTTGKRTGIGISNMISRAENLNGKLVVNSAPGKGCELVAVFPMMTEDSELS